MLQKDKKERNHLEFVSIEALVPEEHLLRKTDCFKTKQGIFDGLTAQFSAVRYNYSLLSGVFLSACRCVLHIGFCVYGLTEIIRQLHSRLSEHIVKRRHRLEESAYKVRR